MRTSTAVALAAAGTALAAGAALLLSRRSELGAAAGEKRSRKNKLKASESRMGKDGKTKLTTYHARDISIQQRIGLMQDLVAVGVQDPDMRKLALQITRHCPARDDVCEAKAIDAWARKNLRYTGDIAPHKLGRKGPVESVDLFQAARRTIEFGGGDCDDHSVAVLTLAALNGIPGKFRVTSPYKWGSNNFTHVYPMLGLPKENPTRWVAADSTLPGGKLGTQHSFAKNVDAPA